ncbi:hypothetical protein FS749_004085, partial [Ceratobasidium sp. UAMH 11750]
MFALTRLDRNTLNDFARRYSAIVPGPNRRLRRKAIVDQAATVVRLSHHDDLRPFADVRKLVYTYIDNHRDPDRERKVRRNYVVPHGVTRRVTRSTKPRMLREVGIPVSRAKWAAIAAARS